MGRDQPLLARSKALSVPLDETSKYLTALLDGSVNKKPKKPDKKASQGDHPRRPAVASIVAAKLTSSLSQPKPKVSGLGVYTLSDLPGAFKNANNDAVNILRSKKRHAANDDDVSVFPPHQSKPLLAPQASTLNVPPTQCLSEPKRATSYKTLLPTRKVTAPTRVSVEGRAPSLTITQHDNAAPARTLALQLKPTKRARYSQNQIQQSSSLSLLRDKISVESEVKVINCTSLQMPTMDSQSRGISEASKETKLTCDNDLSIGLDENKLKASVVSESLPSSAIATSTSTISQKQKPSINISSVRQEIPRPEQISTDTSKRNLNKGNFVRLNMKNHAGACRGARNKKQPYIKRKYQPHDPDNPTPNTATRVWQATTIGAKEAGGLASTSGIDPVDDFLDGIYTGNVDVAATAKQSKITNKRSSTIPNCSGHQQPCKLLTVKKNTENKGRQFYCCSFPRGDQCNHFEWADDTLEAAQAALLKNQSVSGFIARQVAAYMAQIKQHTVPELADLLQRHGLDGKGKKQQLLTRIAVWVRDEVAKGIALNEGNTDDDEQSAKNDNLLDERSGAASGDHTDDDYTCSSDDELEFVGQSMDKIDSVYELAKNDEAGNDAEPQCESETILHTTLRKLFGHSTFREGQEWTIRRCLDNERTLLVAPTGFGKSLCYTLTAALKEGVCIVVSPLLSLIQDQLRLLPPGMAAVTLSGTMTRSKLAATLDDIARGRIKIVFVSPERLTSASFRRLFRLKWSPELKTHKRIFPPVSLFCVDEAHTLSQWSHHFRPSYLRLRSVMAMIEPQSVLAITATAGPKVVNDICHILDIRRHQEVTDADGSKTHEGIRLMSCDRDNIDISCCILSSQEQRLAKLIGLLGHRKHAKADCDATAGLLSSGSVIIYVWRQRDAEAVAENIQAAAEVRGGVTVYHGGMDAAARSKAQSKFMRGKIRICVATVAFGLGINKGDIAGVIHMYLSASPEHYLQEIGRAGRDGQQAHAVALILADEVLVRHSLAHSDMISISQLKSLLHYLARCVDEALKMLPGESMKPDMISVGLMMSECTKVCDCKAETVETVVSLLEQREESLLVVEGWKYDKAHVSPRRNIEKLAAREPVVRAILMCAKCTEQPAGERPEEASNDYANDQKLASNVFGAYSFSVAQCANCLGSGAEPRHVFAALRRLKLSGDIDYVLDLSDAGKGLNIKILRAGLKRLKVEGLGLIDGLAKELAQILNGSVAASCRKVLNLDRILRQVASLPSSTVTKAKSSRLCLFQQLIREYFEADRHDEPNPDKGKDVSLFADLNQRSVSADVRSIFSYLTGMENSLNTLGSLALSDCSDYASLAIAKFLHGINASGRYPSAAFYQHALFGRLQDSQFSRLHNEIHKIINN